jgi:hypothetical protein
MVSIDVLTIAGDTLSALQSIDDAFSIPDTSNSEQLYASAFEGTTYKLVRYQDHAILDISTRLETRLGSFVVRIIKDAEPYRTRITELRQWIVFEIAISVFLGILMSLLLTYFIKVRISTLTTASRIFLSGEKNARLEQGSISEFIDLGSTMSILVNVFHKNLDWYRRSIQQKEQERTSDQLARFVKESNPAPICFSKDGFSIMAALTGTQRHSIFIAVPKAMDRVLLWGSISEQDPLEAALITEAISEFIHSYQNRDTDLIQALNNIFGHQICELNQLKLSRAPIFTIKTTVAKAERELELDASKQTVTWIHSLDKSITEKIDAYTRYSTSLSHDQLFSDIRTLIGHNGSTVIIGVRYEN